MSLFKDPVSRPIVPWAPRGAVIPIVCKECGAVFLTKNKAFVGHGDIVYGDDYDACERCIRAGHNDPRNYIPNEERYEDGRWN